MATYLSLYTSNFSNLLDIKIYLNNSLSIKKHVERFHFSKLLLFFNKIIKTEEILIASIVLNLNIFNHSLIDHVILDCMFDFKKSSFI